MSRKHPSPSGPGRHHRPQARQPCETLNIDLLPDETAPRRPRVASFSGHMIDAPGRTAPRFPDDPAHVSRVAGGIGRWLERERVDSAYCAAACGADLIFIGELQRRGVEAHIVLPWPEADFVASSVRPGGERWVREYKRLRAHFSSVTCLGREPLPEAPGLAYEYCNSCINGLALLRARARDAEVRTLVVWDGLRGDGPGGTASFVDFWWRRGVTPEIVGVAPPSASGGGDRAPQNAWQPPLNHPETIAPRGHPSIATLLVAEVVGDDETGGAYLRDAVRGLLAQLGLRRALYAENIRGGALCLDFDNVNGAGEFALRLRAERGLPAGAAVRIGLHTGPILWRVDQATGHLMFTGAHVRDALHVLSMVEAGEIFVSEAFVAFVEIARRDGKAIPFRCDRLGPGKFAEDRGRYPLFRLCETTGAAVP